MRRQSEHLDEYRAALRKLDAMGLIYPSFESRAEIARAGRRARDRERWPRDPDGAPLYPGTRDEHAGRASASARIARGEPYALRLDMAAATARAGAARLERDGRRSVRRDRRHRRRSRAPGATSSSARKETPTSYHLPVVIDDAAQGVTDVVRGQDLF